MSSETTNPPGQSCVARISPDSPKRQKRRAPPQRPEFHYRSAARHSNKQKPGSARRVAEDFGRNAPAAEAKLKNEPNIDLLYGDSREILPRRLQSGDAVLIDGPKDFRALKLAVDLLRTGKPGAVFVHDFPANSSQRKFVERNFSNAFFGDDPLFQRFQSLDNERDPRPNPQRRYGIFVCLPPPLPMPYWKLRFRLLTHGK